MSWVSPSLEAEARPTGWALPSSTAEDLADKVGVAKFGGDGTAGELGAAQPRGGEPGAEAYALAALWTMAMACCLGR